MGVDTGSNRVIVIGGGLSGLSAAVQLAASGTRVVLLEGSAVLGGRARTLRRRGFHLNLGPHHLCERGAAVSALRRLGVAVPWASRGPNGGLALWRGARHIMPTGWCSLVSTGLFSPAGKLELARLLAGLPSLDLAALRGRTLREWLAAELADRHVVEFVLALTRFATYAHDPDRQCAAAAVEQLRLMCGGPILYVHRGWSALVDSLRREAMSKGAMIHTNGQAVAVNADGGRATSVTLDDGRTMPCAFAIVATGPRHAHALLGDQLMPAVPLDPVCVAALDLALRRLPDRRIVFALGIDEPVYVSADSTIADLAPGAGAVVHAARYLPTGSSGTAEDELSLERLMDLTQPGWRQLVVFRRFMPRAIVSHALVTADAGGLAGRPCGRVAGLDNVFLAGDWIGPTGQLADAAIAAGLRAARAVERLAAA